MPILKRISELQIFELGGRVPKYVIRYIPDIAETTLKENNNYSVRQSKEYSWTFFLLKTFP